jgi:hypothetical protein
MKIPKFNPSSLPYAAAMTTALLLLRSGVQYFGVWGWVIGPLAGLLASFALATAGSGIGTIANSRKWVGYPALGAMLFLSPLVIVFSDPHPTLATWVWAMYPDVAILLASTVTGRNMLAKTEPPAQPTTNPKKASYKPAQPVFICKVAGCTAKPFGSQSALNAHQRIHAKGRKP